MRRWRWTVTAGAVMALPVLFGCGRAAPPPVEGAPVVAAFTEGTSPAAQARHAVSEHGRRNLAECRAARQQGVYPRERRFPCEAFLGE